MKFTCRQSDLFSKLSLLSRIVPNNPTHPILANVLVTAEENRIGLSAFDLSIGIQLWIPATVEETGTLTLPARLLTDIVGKLPSQEILLTADDLAVTLTCGTGRYQMQGISADEFPALPTLDEVAPLKVDKTVFSDGLHSTLFATSSDESKQILTGLHITASEDGLELCSTDGHRLAIARFPEELVSDAIKVTVPARALRELERMLGRTGEKIEVRSDDSQIVFELLSEQGVERLTCRILDGQYPACQQLVPKSFDRKAIVNRQEFMSAIDRISVIAARKNNIIRLKFDAEICALYSEAPEFGSGEESVPAVLDGTPIEIAFNVKYLSEGLRAIASADVEIKLNAPTMPAILSPVSGESFIYLIMPIQIRT